MKAIVSTPNNGKPLVFKKAEYDGKIKHIDFDMWLHKENGCNGSIQPNGKPGYYDCIKCGTMFKKQSMLASQIETREERAKDLISEVRRDNHQDCGFYVRSQSRPKAYVVYKDSHGNWHCPCEDFKKHKKYDAWHCKHILACEYWLENEQKSKERAFTNRPSLICTGTQDEFELANRLDEKQIVRGETEPLAWLINDKVAISYAGTLILASRIGVTVTDVETKEASDKIVATAKAHNPKTGNTQAGAHSQTKLISGRPDNDAEAKAQGKAVRNAILKVIPEVTIYQFANKHAQEPPFDYLEAFYACQKVYTDKGLGDFHVSSVVKELYPDKPPAEIDRDGWIAIYKACQKHADELEANPDVEKSKSYWAKTKDGDVVLVTETGDNKSPSPRCEFYEKGRCKRCLVSHPYLGIGHTHPKVACDGDIDSDACKRMQERFPGSFGITPPDDGKFYVNGKFNPDFWKVGLDEMMANLKGITVEEYRQQKEARA